MTESIVNFAREAAAFHDWAIHPLEKNEAVARQALEHISGLYRAALFLPRSGAPDENAADRHHQVQEAERKSVHTACSRLPFHYYSEVCDPFESPPEEPAVGGLADDIADIYGDVITGLRMHEAANNPEMLTLSR